MMYLRRINLISYLLVLIVSGCTARDCKPPLTTPNAYHDNLKDRCLQTCHWLANLNAQKRCISHCSNNQHHEAPQHNSGFTFKDPNKQ